MVKKFYFGTMHEVFPVYVCCTIVRKSWITSTRKITEVLLFSNGNALHTYRATRIYAVWSTFITKNGNM